MNRQLFFSWSSVALLISAMVSCSETESGDTIDAFTEVRSELSRDDTPDISDDDYEAFISATNRFGWALFEQLSTSDENLVMSGTSVASALGMTFGGAKNNTAQEMAATLNIEISDEAFHAGANRLAMALASRNIAAHETEEGEKRIELSLVNQLWAQQNYSIEDGFLDILAVNYGAGVKLLDFRSAPDPSRAVINGWVAEQTKERIEELIPQGAIGGNTKVVLTNALYFYGSWDTPFDPERTADGPFKTLSGEERTVPMMHAAEVFGYREHDGYQVLDLPYDGRELSMAIVLPASGRFEEVRGALISQQLDIHADIDSEETMVAVTLPKFSVTWGTQSLKLALETLGMRDAFAPDSADFSGISLESNLNIADVFHKAFIGVDERGTEAAAATAVILDDRGVPETVPFTVDRPFLFVIRDLSGVVLFSGQVTSLGE